MIRASKPTPPIIMECGATAAERAQAIAERERYMLNVRWFESHAEELGKTHVGEYVCVAGQEVFAGNTLGDVLAEAKRKHPEESRSLFYKYISTHRGPKIYANLRLLASV